MATYRFIGWGITNNNGIATLDYDANGNPLQNSGLVGTGAGELDIVASLDDPDSISDSSLQSVTYGVIDAFNVDDGTTENTDWLSNSNLTVTPSANGKTVTNNVSSQQAFDLNKHGTSTSTTYDFTLPLVVEMDIIDMTGEIRFRINDSSSHTDSVDLTNISNKHFKMEFEDDFYRYFLDGEQQGSDRVNTVTGNCRFRIILLGNASYTFKNFAIYPI